MKKKLTKTSPTSSGSCISFKALFLFSQTKGWWGKYLPGFTHVALFISPYETLDEGMLFNPKLPYPRIDFYLENPLESLVSFDTVIEASISPTYRNRLIRPIFQTCTTIIQYICGISLGCTTAQGLYKCLVTKDGQWLAKKGISEVKVWETSSSRLVTEFSEE